MAVIVFVAFSFASKVASFTNFTAATARTLVDQAPHSECCPTSFSDFIVGLAVVRTEVGIKV